MIQRVVSQLSHNHRVALRREGDMVKLALHGHHPLTVERISNRLLLCGHTFSNDHMLIRLPEFTFHIDKNVWTPVSWRRGDVLIEAADLDEDDEIVQVDPVRAAMIWNEAEGFAAELAACGWLRSAEVLVALPVAAHSSFN